MEIQPINRLGVLIADATPPPLLDQILSGAEHQGIECQVAKYSNDQPLLSSLHSLLVDAFIICADGDVHTVITLIGNFISTEEQIPVALIADHVDSELVDFAYKTGVSEVYQVAELTEATIRRALRQLSQITHTQKSVRYRLDFEKLISLISTNFINLPTEQIDGGINDALELIGRYAGVDRSYILNLDDTGDSFSMSHEWHIDAVDSARSSFQAMPASDFPDLLFRARNGHVMFYEDINDLPSNAEPFRKKLARRGVKSMLCVPMGGGSSFQGLVGFASLRSFQRWSRELVALLEVCGQIFLNALSRREVELALRESENRFRNLIDNLGEGVIFCDRDDKILHVNTRFLTMTGFTFDEVIDRKAYQLFLPEAEANELRRRTQRRLQGITETYRIRFRKKDGERFWAEIHATPMRNSAGEIIGTLGAATDISERVSAIEALRGSEKKYRELVETSADLIWSMDIQGRWTFVNQATEKIYGYSPDEMVGEVFTEFVVKDSAAKDLEVFNEVLQGKRVEQYETVHRKKDGGEVVLSFNAHVMQNDEGVVLGTSGTATDISQRRAAERHLEEQQDFLRQLIDINPNLIYCKDLNGSFTLVNQAVADLCEKPVDYLIGKDAGALAATAEEARIFAEQDREVIETGKMKIIPEELITSPITGEKRWYSTIKKPVYLGGGRPQQIMGISIDMHERKEAEDALKAVLQGTASSTADDFLQSLVRHLAVSLDATYSWIAVLSKEDDRYYDVLAQWDTENNASGDPYLRAGSFSEEVLKRGIYYIHSDLQKAFPAPLFLREYNFQSAIGVAITNSSGVPIGILGVFNTSPLDQSNRARDILNIFAARTSAEIERIEAERERVVLQSQLTQSQKMDAIGQLAAGIAHDLNNALGAVVGHLQLMRLSPELGAQVTESLDIALSGCERASSLIEHLLGFSRQGKYNLRKLSVQTAVVDTLKFLKHVISKNITVEMGNIPRELFVNADPNQLQQALTNLIINAQHAMDNYGIIKFRFESEFVKHAEQFNPKAKPGRYVVVRVADSGVGIDSEKIAKVFEPFYTTKEEGKGTGLGLSMVYGIMQNHGGWVTADSDQCAGAVFSLYFPEVSGKLELIEQQPETQRSKATGRVMVIDDERFLVDLAARFLERNGFQASGHISARKAIEWYRNHYKEIDLIILDMKMPDMDGAACFEVIREINPQARVIILSGYIHDEAAQNILDRGAIRFFQKPLKYQELMDWIKKFLELENKHSQSLSDTAS